MADNNVGFPAGEFPRGFLFSGVVLCILGLLGAVFPFFSTFASDVFIGSILVAAGILLGCKALLNRKWKGIGLDLAGACINFCIGVVFLAYPVVGMSLIALFFTAIMATDGFFKTAFAFLIRPVRDWWIFLAAGIFELGLCFFLILIWPSDSVWVPGLFIGFYLWSTGISLIAFNSRLKRLTNS